MKEDFELIVHKLERELDHINIYPIGDLHVGSPEFNKEMWNTWKKEVMADENGYIVILGDMMNNALKTSKSNSYDELMRPRDQKEWLVNEFRPMKDKILGVCTGNHEYRSLLVGDDCPLYDVCAKLDIEDLYRENMAFIKVNLGAKRADRQWSYTLALAHGGSKGKTSRFGYAIDGLDMFITAHTHTPENGFPAKIVIDSKNECVYMQDFMHLVLPSFQSFGGYALRNMYMPNSNTKYPVIRLSGERKEVQLLWK